MAAQREQIKQKQEAAAAEYRQQREQEAATAVAELDKKAAALCAECGATWHFTGSDGCKPFAVGGGAPGHETLPYNAKTIPEVSRELRACLQAAVDFWAKSDDCDFISNFL